MAALGYQTRPRLALCTLHAGPCVRAHCTVQHFALCVRAACVRAACVRATCVLGPAKTLDYLLLGVKNLLLTFSRPGNYINVWFEWEFDITSGLILVRLWSIEQIDTRSSYNCGEIEEFSHVRCRGTELAPVRGVEQIVGFFGTRELYQLPVRIRVWYLYRFDFGSVSNICAYSDWSIRTCTKFLEVRILNLNVNVN